MARKPYRQSSLTSSGNGNLERQAKRLLRQQKRLENELVAEMGQHPVLSGAKTRPITLNNLKRLEPLTDTQADFFDAYDAGESPAFLLAGHAGTGKSFIQIFKALEDLLDPNTPYEKILISKPQQAVVSSGFLPGTIEDKILPYEAPYHGIFADLLGRADAYEKLKETGKLEFVVDSYVRSHTFNNSIIIYDEVQNNTFSTLHGMMTRIGKNSKIILCGDGKQSDLNKRKEEKTGFYDLYDVAKYMKEFEVFDFTVEDVVRSGLCKQWIIACTELRLI